VVIFLSLGWLAILPFCLKNAILYAFSTGASKEKVFFYATCREKHEDEAEHYHCVVKLTGPKRWLGAKNHLVNRYSATVNFSDDHDS